jgi:hypothetical protein
MKYLPAVRRFIGMQDLDYPVCLVRQCGKRPVHAGRIQDYQSLVPGIPESGSNGSQETVCAIEQRGIVLNEDHRVAGFFQNGEQLIRSKRSADLKT